VLALSLVCRHRCGVSVCGAHSANRMVLPGSGNETRVRVCDTCCHFYDLPFIASPTAAREARGKSQVVGCEFTGLLSLVRDATTTPTTTSFWRREFGYSQSSDKAPPPVSTNASKLPRGPKVALSIDTTITHNVSEWAKGDDIVSPIAGREVMGKSQVVGCEFTGLLSLVRDATTTITTTPSSWRREFGSSQSSDKAPPPVSTNASKRPRGLTVDTSFDTTITHTVSDRAKSDDIQSASAAGCTFGGLLGLLRDLASRT
jgi:hypothetical protein